MHVYDNFIQNIDAIDNGVDAFDFEEVYQHYKASTEYKYVPTPMYNFWSNPSMGVANLNSGWNTEYWDKDGALLSDNDIQMVNFKDAMQSAKEKLEGTVISLYTEFIPA